MDDKLFYVESPDGKVLGPMTMIHILEGIAAGAILETARICEVGRQEWVELSEIAYTHVDAAPTEAELEEQDPFGLAEEPVIVDDDTLAPETPLFEEPGSFEPDPLLDENEPLTILSGATFENDELVSDPELAAAIDPAAAAAKFAMNEADETANEAEEEDLLLPRFDPVSLEPVAKRPPSGTFAVPRIDFQDPNDEMEAEEAPETEIAATTASHLYEPPAPAETPVAREAEPWPEDSEFETSTRNAHGGEVAGAAAIDEFLTPTDATEWVPEAVASGVPADLPASAFPEDGTPMGADDFALQMPAEDEYAESAEPEATPRKRRNAWLAPVAVAIALPIVAGVYVLAGGKVPFRAETTASAPANGPAANTPKTPSEEAWAALGAGHPEQAVPILREILAKDPNDVRAHHGLGLAESALGKHDAALASLTKAIELDGANVKIRVDMGRVQLAAKDAAAAVATAKTAREIDPTHDPALRLLGVAELAAGNSEAAVQSLTQYARAHADDAEIRFDLAKALAATGRLEPAIDEVGAYLEAKPEDASAQMTRLEWMRSAKRSAEAAQLYAGIAKKRPKDAKAWYFAGVANEDTDDAIPFLEKSLALDPDYQPAKDALRKQRAKVGRAARTNRTAETIAAAPAAGSESASAQAEPTSPSNPEVAVTDTQALPEPARSEPVETEPTIRVTNTVSPASGAPKDDLSARLASVRRALTQGDFRGAHALIENAMTDFAADADARRNVQLWTGILAFEEGRLDEALATFRGLDASASYEASGFGAGTVANWEARVLLAQGDVRGAIAALDGVGADDPNEYAAARLWEGMALASLGMTELAERTWERLPSDMGSRVSGAGKGAVKSAEFLAGAIADKDYRTAVSSIDGYQNDMYFFLGWRARQEKQLDVARDNYRKVLDSSRGHEFPFDLARSEIDGKGLGGEWPAE